MKKRQVGWPTAVATGSLAGAGGKAAGSKGDVGGKAAGACEFKGGFQNLLRIRDH